MTTSAGKVVLKHILPTDMKHYADKRLDAKTIKSLFSDLAEKHPDSYKDVVSKLARLGFETSTRLGSSVSLEDLRSPIDKKKRFGEVEAQIEEIRKKRLPKEVTDRHIAQTYTKFLDALNHETLEEGLKQNKTLAKIILSGSRGSPTQYRQTVTAPGIVPDSLGRPLIDFPIHRSFAEGLTPTDYLAHSFGTRTGLASVKLATADAGFLSKQLFRSAATIKVEEFDCGTHRGIPISTANKEYVGSFLAQPAGDLKYNNEVTLSALHDLQHAGVDEIVVRSPITCESNKKFHHGAVCQLCVGKRDNNRLRPIGDYVGVTAGTVGGEKLGQGSLSAKHSSSSVKKQTIIGVPLVNQLVNIPESFRDKAPLAEKEGKVKEIRDLPQGGKEVVIQDSGGKLENYYINPGFDPVVRVGQHVEAGDTLSDGLLNPSDVVRLKGIGEGRRYLGEALKNAFEESGFGLNQRNFDVLSRNMVDHVRITDNEGIGHYLPNQIVSYNTLEQEYRPRATAKATALDHAKGLYLESPAGHYTIGTPINSKVIDTLRKQGVAHVLAHEHKPGFEPEMQRLLDIPAYEDDWMHQLYSTYIQKRFLDAVNKGMSSNLHGASPIPAIAAGTIGKKAALEDIALSLYKKAGAGGYGCALIRLPMKDSVKILRWGEDNIPDSELAADGREHEIHVTVLFGFHPEVTAEELREFASEQTPVAFKLGKISRFENKFNDVLKIEVESSDLKELHDAMVKRFDGKVTITYPDYIPHITLAYVKNGALRKLDGHSHFDGDVYYADKLVYSEPMSVAKHDTPIGDNHKEAMALLAIEDSNLD